jgi:hypothetical protein
MAYDFLDQSSSLTRKQSGFGLAGYFRTEKNDFYQNIWLSWETLGRICFWSTSIIVILKAKSGSESCGRSNMFSKNHFFPYEKIPQGK